MFLDFGAFFFWTCTCFLDLEQVGGIQILRQDACKKLLMQGKFGYWNNKKVRSGEEANGGKFTYEAKWTQEIERHIGGRESSILKSCWEMRGEAIETKRRHMHKIAQRRGGKFWDQNVNARSCWEAQGGGNLDIGTRCMQEGVERNGGTCRYWSQMTAENWWERGRWERGKLDIETRMSARSCWDEKRKSRYWTQMTVHARSCGETRGGKLWYWNRMNAGSCWEAQVGGTLGGHGGTRYKTKWMQAAGDIEARWMQEVAEGHRGGSLDIETRWTQEVAGRLRGKYRNWNPVNAGSLGGLMRGTWGGS